MYSRESVNYASNNSHLPIWLTTRGYCRRPHCQCLLNRSLHGDLRADAQSIVKHTRHHDIQVAATLACETICGEVASLETRLRCGHTREDKTWFSRITCCWNINCRSSILGLLPSCQLQVMNHTNLVFLHTRLINRSTIPVYPKGGITRTRASRVSTVIVILTNTDTKGVRTCR